MYHLYITYILFELLYKHLYVFILYLIHIRMYLLCIIWYLNCAFNIWYKLYVCVIYSTELLIQLFILFSLGFSVTIFCIEAFLAIMILMLRRNPAIGGELGGPKSFKTISSGLFVFFWVFYVFISALEAYEVIKPGF